MFEKLKEKLLGKERYYKLGINYKTLIGNERIYYDTKNIWFTSRKKMDLWAHLPQIKEIIRRADISAISIEDIALSEVHKHQYEIKDARSEIIGHISSETLVKINEPISSRCMSGHGLGLSSLL